MICAQIFGSSGRPCCLWTEKIYPIMAGLSQAADLPITKPIALMGGDSNRYPRHHSLVSRAGPLALIFQQDERRAHPRAKSWDVFVLFTAQARYKSLSSLMIDSHHTTSSKWRVSMDTQATFMPSHPRRVDSIIRGFRPPITWPLSIWRVTKGAKVG